MPAHRKPPTLKLLSGSREPSRPQVDLPPVDAPPPAPDWLPTAHAVNEWHRLAAILHANKLLTEAGLGPLAVLCAVFGRIVQCYMAGEAPSGHLVAQYRGLCGDFGLTPAAASRVTPADSGKKKENPFTNNGVRPDK